MIQSPEQNITILFHYIWYVYNKYNFILFFLEGERGVKRRKKKALIKPVMLRPNHYTYKGRVIQKNKLNKPTQVTKKGGK